MLCDGQGLVLMVFTPTAVWSLELPDALVLQRILETDLALLRYKRKDLFSYMGCMEHELGKHLAQLGRIVTIFRSLKALQYTVQADQHPLY